MATQVQLRRGTTTQHSTFTGALGEVTFDTDKNTLIVHDGTTAGGHELAKTGVAGSFTTGAFSSDVTITGNLTVNGTTTTVNSNTLEIGDNQIVLNSDETGTPSQNGGIEIERGTSTNVVLRWNETTDKWEATEDGTNYYNVLLSDDIGVSVQGYDANNVVSDASSTFTADQSFGDNVKATFGNASDLMIYHDGQRSIIQDQGTGNLRIQAANLELNSWDNDENYIFCQDNGAVTLYYDNSPKLATSSTGIDVTGTATMDGLTVSNATPIITLYDTDISDGPTINGNSGNLYFNTTSVNRDFIFRDNLNALRCTIAGDGNISFYDSAGSNAKLHWDAGDNRLGIGTTTPSQILHVEDTAASNTSTYIQVVSGNAGNAGIAFGDSDADLRGGILYNNADDALRFFKSGFTEGARLDTNGNFNIGRGATHTDTSARLAVFNSGNSESYSIRPGTDNANQIDILSYNYGTSSYLKVRDIANEWQWFSGGSGNRMILDTSGNLHVACESHQASASTGTGGYTLGTLGVSARSGDVTHYFNRLGSDGRIVEFRKYGAIMGGIGSDETQPDGTENTNTATLYIGAGDAGLGFTDDGDFIYPYDFDSATPSHNVITLGHSSKKFKHGYFAGTLYAARGISNTNTGTPSSAPTPSFDTDNNWVWTLTTNITLGNSSDHAVGQSGFFIFKQDSTGGRTVSLGSYYKTPGGAGLTLSSAANAIDMVPYVVISSTEILLGTPQLAFA